MTSRAATAAVSVLAALLLSSCASDLQESTTPNQVDSPGPGVSTTPQPLEGTPTPAVLSS